MQLNYGLLPKGGGGDPRQSKSFGTLFVHQQFLNFGQKRGGLTKSNSFWTLFTLILVKYDTKSAPKVPGKKSAYEKVSQKFQKSGGWGGVGGGKTFLEEVHN